MAGTPSRTRIAGHFLRRISVFILIMIIMLILAAGWLGIELSPGKVAAAENFAALGEVRLEGRICEVSYVDEEQFKMVMDADGAGRVMLRVSGDFAGPGIYSFPGRRANVRALVSRPEPAANPGGFDWALYLRTEGIFLEGECKISDVQLGELCQNPFKGFFINRVSVLKNEFYEKLAAVSGETAAALYCGMLFGDKDRLSDDIYSSFRDNGTAHILSVSGLHVGVLYGFINLLLGKRRRSLISLIITGLALTACAFLASFSISVLRAVFMIGLHIIAERTHNRYDVLAAACVTAAVFLIIRPDTLYSTGFILSFSAVMSLAVIGKGLQRMIKTRNIATGILFPIFAIQIGTVPINAHIFNYFSAASFISNIPVIFLSSIMIPAGIILLILIPFGEMFSAIYELMINMCALLSDMMIFFNDATGAYGRLCFRTASPSVFFTAFFYLVIFLIFSEHMYLHPPGKKSALLISFAVILLLPALFIEEALKPEVVFVSIGQGDCAHIRTPGGKNFIVDGGGSLFSDYDTGEKIIEPYLLKNGVDEIDGVFISHMDADHYKGIASVSERMDTGAVYLYEGYRNCEDAVAELLNKQVSDIIYVNCGDVIELDKDVYVEILYPSGGRKLAVDGTEGKGEGADLNENSLVFRLNYKGTEILFTGDIGEAEADIKGDFSCDIIKVPHHGSKYSSSEDFVSDLGAKAAVIQVGKNNFGHPAQSVIERYTKNGIMVFRNDIDGAVSVYIDRSGFDIKCHKSGEKYEF